MEVDGVMMPRPRIPEGPASPGWAPPPLPEPSPGLEDWPDHLELLEVEGGSEDGRERRRWRWGRGWRDDTQSRAANDDEALTKQSQRWRQRW